MIVLKEQIYNPKIDYLIIRNLILLPFEYDELRLRDVYKGKKEYQTHEERIITTVKAYFSNCCLKNFKVEDIFNLYYLITEERLPQSDLDFSSLMNLFLCIKKLKIKDNLTLFRIALLKFMYDTRAVLIIPYRNLCRKLFIACDNGNFEEIVLIERKLIKRVNKYHHQHTFEYNDVVLKLISDNMKPFVEKFKLSGFGLYGSYALGKASIYSDLDILILVDNIEGLYELKNQCLNYWKKLIEIPIDIFITTKEALEFKVKKSIRDTVKILYEVWYERIYRIEKW